MPNAATTSHPSGSKRGRRVLRLPWIRVEELLLDPNKKIAVRGKLPGHDTRHYVPIDQRS